jgi:hypothetical protein
LNGRRENGIIVCSPVSLQQQTETDRIVTARERYVARGISTTDLVVARAEGPVLATDQDLERSLDTLEESLVDADRAGA